MKSENFCYWLQGFFEISGIKEITKEQCEIIKNHLDMVFEHEIDPKFGKDKEKLQEIHDKTKRAFQETHWDPHTKIMC